MTTTSDRLEYFMSQNVELMGDIQFSVGVEKESVRAFKFILKEASPVFEAMLSDKWTPLGQKKIDLPHDDPASFRLFLWLLGHKEAKNSNYLVKLGLSTVEVLELWHICKKYSVPPLDKACRQFLHKVLDHCAVEDAVLIFDTIRGSDEEELEKASLKFIRDNLTLILDTPSFLELSKDALHKILMDGDNLVIDDLKLFHGLCRWAVLQCTKNEEVEMSGGDIREILGEIFFHIRFHLMTLEDFKKFIIPAKILTKEESDYFQLHIQMAGLTLSGDLGEDEEKQESNLDLKFPRRLKPRKFVGETISTLPDNPGGGAVHFNRDLYLTRFTVSHKLALHSFGFQCPPSKIFREYRAIIMLSPQCGPFVSSPWTTGRGSPIFHVHLQEPFILEANSSCTLRYILRAVAPTTITESSDSGGDTKNAKLSESFVRENPSGVKFNFFALSPGPLCEIRFTRPEPNSRSH